MAFKELSPEKKILSAKTELMFTCAFFSTILQNMITVEMPEVETMAVDGKHLFYAPEFVNSLTRDELVFVLAHEAEHNAKKHHTRRGKRDPDLWNQATDHEINLDLKEGEIGKMPKDGLCDPRFAGLHSEEIYRILDGERQKEQQQGGKQQQQDGQGQGKGQPQPGNKPGDQQGKGQSQPGGDRQGQGQGPKNHDPGRCGGVLDAGKTKEELKKAEAEADMITRQAAMVAAKNPGKMSAAMKRMVEKLLEPVIDWRPVLRRFIDENATTFDYAWTRPNRRLLSMGLVLPGMIPDGVSHIVIFVDTSGSIDNEILAEFRAEINGAFGDGMIDKITVAYADTKVSSWQEFERGDDVELKPTGGGGTDFRDSFEWVAEHAHDASCVIYFTDLYVTQFGEKPHCPVLWAVHGPSNTFDELAAKVPFGEAISLAA